MVVEEEPSMLEASKVSVALERAAFQGLTTTTKASQALTKASAQGWGASKAIFALHHLGLLPKSHSSKFLQAFNRYSADFCKTDIANAHGGSQKASRFSLGVGLEVWEQ